MNAIASAQLVLIQGLTIEKNPPSNDFWLINQ
jgi:hypothetical protein